MLLVKFFCVTWTSVLVWRVYKLTILSAVQGVGVVWWILCNSCSQTGETVISLLRHVLVSSFGNLYTSAAHAQYALEWTSHEKPTAFLHLSASHPLPTQHDMTCYRILKFILKFSILQHLSESPLSVHVLTKILVNLHTHTISLLRPFAYFRIWS